MHLRTFQNGSVRFVPPTPGRPETREKVAGSLTDITIVNSETKGSPAFFEVSFFISCSHDVDGIETSNAFTLETVVPAADNESSYSQVEDNAALQLPGLLRDLAELIEADIDRATRERAREAPPSA